MGVPSSTDLRREGEEIFAKRDKLLLDTIPIGASRFGGVPDLPPKMSWPKFEGKKLPFLAQIDLGELPKSLLPSDGWLFVFGLFDNEHENIPLSVLHHRGLRNDLTRAPQPGDGEIWEDWTGDVTYNVVPLKPATGKDWVEAGWLFGEFEVASERAATIADDQDCSGDDWITLLVIKSVGSMGWSDCGKFHIAIRRCDLEKHDFTRVCAGLSDVC